MTAPTPSTASSEHVVELPEADTPPKNGKWVDPEEYISNPTRGEIREGNRLGKVGAE